MIPKVVDPREDDGADFVRDFRNCVGYVVGKAENVAVRNIASVATAAGELAAIAHQSTKIKHPLYHFILSWAALERPTHVQMVEAGDKALEALGLTEHQAVMAVHRDRDHWHLHVVTNKRGIDGHAAGLSNDYARLEKVCRQVELEQGWSRDRGHFDVAIRDGEVVLVPKAEKPVDKKYRLTGAEIDRERRTGQQPLRTILMEDGVHKQLAAAFEEARTWTALHARLSALGLSYQIKGSGAKLCTIDDPSNACSPSHVDKSWTRSKLEQRFGLFEPPSPEFGQQTSSVKPKETAATCPLPTILAHQADNAHVDFPADDESTADRGQPSSGYSGPLQATEEYFYRRIAGLIKRSMARAGIERQFRARKELAKLARLQKRQGPPEWRSFLSDRARSGDNDAAEVRTATILSRSRDAQHAAGRGKSAEELEAMRRIDLPKLAEQMGYQRDENESTKISVKLRSGADVVVARPERDGTWSYFSAGDDCDNGGVLQFVQRRRGGNLGAVRQFLRPFLGTDYLVTKQMSDVERHRDHTAARQAWMVSRHVMPRYLAERGIDPKTLTLCAADQVRQDRRGNVLFAHHDHRGNLVGFEVKGRHWSGFAKGGQKTLAIFGAMEARHRAARIVVTESGIDALSLAQIERRGDTLYVSTGGAIGRRTLVEMQQFVRRHPDAELLLGFDNDVAGDKMADRFEGDRTTRLRPPFGKDWNDTLRHFVRRTAHDDLPVYDIRARAVIYDDLIRSDLVSASRHPYDDLAAEERRGQIRVFDDLTAETLWERAQQRVHAFDDLRLEEICERAEARDDLAAEERHTQMPPCRDLLFDFSLMERTDEQRRAKRTVGRDRLEEILGGSAGRHRQPDGRNPSYARTKARGRTDEIRPDSGSVGHLVGGGYRAGEDTAGDRRQAGSVVPAGRIGRTGGRGSAASGGERAGTRPGPVNISERMATGNADKRDRQYGSVTEREWLYVLIAETEDAKRLAEAAGSRIRFDRQVRLWYLPENAPPHVIEALRLYQTPRAKRSVEREQEERRSRRAAINAATAPNINDGGAHFAPTNFVPMVSLPGLNVRHMSDDQRTALKNDYGLKWNKEGKVWEMPANHPKAAEAVTKFGQAQGASAARPQPAAAAQVAPAAAPPPADRFVSVVNEKKPDHYAIFDTTQKDGHGRASIAGFLNPENGSGHKLVTYDGKTVGAGPLAAHHGKLMDPSRPLTTQLQRQPAPTQQATRTPQQPAVGKPQLWKDTYKADTQAKIAEEIGGRSNEQLVADIAASKSAARTATDEVSRKAYAAGAGKLETEAVKRGLIQPSSNGRSQTQNRGEEI